MMIGTQDPTLLAGRRFAIYGKNGYPTNAGSYSLRATIFKQSDVNAINALLNQSVVLQEKPDVIEQRLECAAS